MQYRESLFIAVLISPMTALSALLIWSGEIALTGSRTGLELINFHHKEKWGRGRQAIAEMIFFLSVFINALNKHEEEVGGSLKKECTVCIIIRKHS